MKGKVLALTLALLLAAGALPSAVSAQGDPFVLEAPKNLTAELKYDTDGVPYFELKLDVPQSVLDIDQNLREDSEYYPGTDCYPISIQFDYKYGDYDWNEGPSLYWNTSIDVYGFLDNGGVYHYSPYEDIDEAGAVKIEEEVYTFRAYFYSDWGYVGDWVDNKVMSGFSNTATVGNKAYYSGASDWARPELDKAAEYGLIPESIKDKMSSPITREEFAELAVLLYELKTGDKARPTSPNPFGDCSNPEVLKANNLGIVNGVAADKFDPKALTNREQIAAMLNRAAKVLKPDADYSTTGAPIFADEGQVSGWALENVRYMAKAGFITGVGNNMFNPKGTTTCEQAVIIAVRVFEGL
jgi:hypothetical protein